MKPYRAIAQYYDPECSHIAMLRQDVPLLLSHLPRRRQRVLELATGTGRAAIPLAQAGHRVVGVDYARDMLDIACRKRDSVGIPERDLSFVRSNIHERHPESTKKLSPRKSRLLFLLPRPLSSVRR